MVDSKPLTSTGCLACEHARMPQEIFRLARTATISQTNDAFYCIVASVAYYVSSAMFELEEGTRHALNDRLPLRFQAGSLLYRSA